MNDSNKMKLIFGQTISIDYDIISSIKLIKIVNYIQ